MSPSSPLRAPAANGDRPPLGSGAQPLGCPHGALWRPCAEAPCTWGCGRGPGPQSCPWLGSCSHPLPRALPPAWRPRRRAEQTRGAPRRTRLLTATPTSAVILEKPIRIPRFLSVKASHVLKGFLNKVRLQPPGRPGTVIFSVALGHPKQEASVLAEMGVFIHTDKQQGRTRPRAMECGLGGTVGMGRSEPLRILGGRRAPC